MKNKYIDFIGNKHWKNEYGESHRDENGLPAIEWSNGRKYWCLNGEYHREDGPAIEYAEGYKFWFINGKEHTKQEFNDFLLKKRL